MQARLAQIEQTYSFRTFTIDSFVSWINQSRGRKIFFVPWPMPGTIFGVWIMTATNDYIFYDKETPPVHQVHIKLHELAHILCGHETLLLTKEKLAEMVRDQTVATSVLMEATQRDMTQEKEIEQEAETLSSLIQEQVLRHARLSELTKVISSDQEYTQLHQSLGLI